MNNNHIIWQVVLKTIKTFKCGKSRALQRLEEHTVFTDCCFCEAISVFISRANLIWMNENEMTLFLTCGPEKTSDPNLDSHVQYI